jgi:hypothetical protein
VALVLETGAGVSGANTWVSFSEFVDYFVARNDTEIAEGSDYADEDREGALLYAAREIDQSFEWHGYRTTTVQGLGFPRTGCYDKEGNLIASTEIPEVLKEAQIERAREHLAVRALNEPINPTAELSSLEVGPLALEWDRSLSPIPKNDYYLKLLKGLYAGSTGGVLVTVRA